MKKLTMVLVCLTLAMLGQATTTATQSTTTKQTPKTSTAKTPASATAKTKTGSTAKKPATPATPAITLTDQKSKLSYALGMNLGTNLRLQGVEIDANVLTQAIKDGLTNSKTLMTEDEARNTLMQWQTEMRTKQEEKRQQAAGTNKQEGEAFLAANKTKEGVVTLPSGLQYKIITPGTGPKPTLTDKVVCNYRGTLINGTEFDSSYKRGQPATFPVGGVIKGWTEALQLMPVGSKWQLFIPSELAYGERGAGGDIPPNSTLIFEVELISIEPAQPPAQPTPAPAATPAPTPSVPK